jgi:hypothetical protein
MPDVPLEEQTCSQDGNVTDDIFQAAVHQYSNNNVILHTKMAQFYGQLLSHPVKLTIAHLLHQCLN